jgi:hypothetical protein
MSQPDAMLRSDLLANRTQLQPREVYERQPLFVESVANFNNPRYCSGGLVEYHDALSHMNPEAPRNGHLSTKTAFQLFRIVRNDYAEVLSRYDVSGQHNSHDFWNYCEGKTDVLYFKLWLDKLGNPELNSYCAEGAVLSVGFDTYTATELYCLSDLSPFTSAESIKGDGIIRGTNQHVYLIQQ